MTHIFTINNCNIALDVHSGAVHVLDDTAYGVLTGSLTDPVAQKEIDGLIAAGQLFSPAPNKEEEISYTQNRPPIVKSLCLHIAHDCNLRCKYCFAGEGDYGARGKKTRSLMSLDVGKSAIDFLIQNSGNRQNLEVDFFGGEPTLNFDTVKEIVKYAKSREDEADKNFRFTFTTNGLLLDDEKIEYLNQHMDNIVLSLDGRKEVNDHMRGKGCYDKVLPNFRHMAEKMTESQKSYYIRGTYTRENLDFASDIIHMAELGFKNLSVEPVVAPPSAPYALRQEDIPALCKEYERLSAFIATHPDINFFHFKLDLLNGPCVAKRITGCGAGTEYLAITPEGDIYPCHQFVGDDQFLLGSLQLGIVKTLWQQEFAHCNVYTKPECDECWAKYFCSGGCAANAFHINGDIMKPDHIGCELQKKRLECALYLLQFR